VISKSTTIIKNHFYNYDPPEPGTSEAPPVHATDTIIKRFRINYSYEEKYRLGIMTPQEYAAWQMELFRKQQEEQEAERLERERAAADSIEGGTFWANDTTIRTNISGDDYNKFLAENGLDVSNTTAVDVGQLIQQENDRVIGSIGYTTAQGSIDGILQSADQERAQEEAVMMASSSDSSDPNRVLSEEEIAALFAAMAAS